MARTTATVTVELPGPMRAALDAFVKCPTWETLAALERATTDCMGTTADTYAPEWAEPVG